MKNLPLISVIIPVYNVENYLDKCIESVTEQRYKNLEIILVDDGSLDNSLDICNEWAKKDSRIVVIHKDNGGVSSARNAGLDVANGEFVTFVDSDDTVDKRLIETLYIELIRNKVDCSICNMNIVTENSTQVRCEIAKILILDKFGIINEVLLNGITSGYACGKMFKREMISEIKFAEDIHFAEDELFVIQVLSKCNKVIFIPDPLYNYFQRCTGATGGNFNEKMYTLCLAQDRIKEVLWSIGNKEIYDVAEVASLRIKIGLFYKLYLSNMQKSEYCQKLRQSIRSDLSMKICRKLRFVNKIEVVLIVINYKLFFLWMRIKSIIKILR